MERFKNHVALNSALLILTTISIIIQSCGFGDSNSGPLYISSNAFSFNASVDPATLVQVQDQGINIARQQMVAVIGGQTSPPNSYVITNSEELNSLNQAFSTHISLSDLDSHIYFFFFDGPIGCGSDSIYSDQNYNNGVLTITMNHYFKYPGSEVACIGPYDIMFVFKAHKT